MNLKSTQTMLLNEMKNLQRDRYAHKKRSTIAEKRFGMISDFLENVITKVKVGHNKDAEVFHKRINALNEVTAEDLRRAGVDRLIQKGKTELLAKIAIISTANTSKVHKSTNTNSS
jgi:hypothetical protein